GIVLSDDLENPTEFTHWSWPADVDITTVMDDVRRISAVVSRRPQARGALLPAVRGLRADTRHNLPYVREDEAKINGWVVLARTADLVAIGGLLGKDSPVPVVPIVLAAGGAIFGTHVTLRAFVGLLGARAGPVPARTCRADARPQERRRAGLTQ